jgi:hypothetical protein
MNKMERLYKNALELSYEMHVAMRKSCNGPASSAAWNYIHVVPSTEPDMDDMATWSPSVALAGKLILALKGKKVTSEMLSHEIRGQVARSTSETYYDLARGKPVHMAFGCILQCFTVDEMASLAGWIAYRGEGAWTGYGLKWKGES